MSKLVSSASPHKLCPLVLLLSSLPIFEHILILLRISLTPLTPKLHPLLEVKLHQCWVQWDNHLFPPLSCTMPNAPHGRASRFGHQGTLLSCNELTINQTHRSLSPGLHSAACPPVYSHVQNDNTPDTGSGILPCQVSYGWRLPNTLIYQDFS